MGVAHALDSVSLIQSYMGAHGTCAEASNQSRSEWDCFATGSDQKIKNGKGSLEQDDARFDLIIFMARKIEAQLSVKGILDLVE